MGRDRVERIWRREGLKVPKKQPRKGRLWLNDGSCLRLRPCWRDHVWAYDFVADRTQDGRPLKMLTVVDEYTRECLAIEVERRADSMSVLERLAALFVERGVPDYIRSDNGSEFTAWLVRNWLARSEFLALVLTRARRSVIATVDEAGEPGDFTSSGITAEEHRRLEQWPEGPRWLTIWCCSPSSRRRSRRRVPPAPPGPSPRCPVRGRFRRSEGGRPRASVRDGSGAWRHTTGSAYICQVKMT